MKRENTICIPEHVCVAQEKWGEEKKRREVRGEEGGGFLESQFEEWLKSLDIKSGVWGLC